MFEGCFEGCYNGALRVLKMFPECLNGVFMFMGDSKVFDGYLKDISRLFLGVLTLLGMGGATLCPDRFHIAISKIFQ